MAKYSNPREFTIAADVSGFYLVDEFGEEAEAGVRYVTYHTANGRIHWLIDNWEPRDQPGWEGGFADNH